MDFKFEEALREGEIKQFALGVTPKTKFIFDNYKIQDDLFKQSNAPTPQEKQEAIDDANDDFFSFFSSHEKIIMKPESSFKHLRSFLTALPIDYYILLQKGYEKPREF
jgi:hypothetical protein